jgi:hypothetical protein
MPLRLTIHITGSPAKSHTHTVLIVLLPSSKSSVLLRHRERVSGGGVWGKPFPFLLLLPSSKSSVLLRHRERVSGGGVWGKPFPFLLLLASN